MKKLLFVFCFILIAQFAFSQNKPVILKHLVIDRYGMKRIKLSEGDRIWFSLKGEPKNRRYKDYIAKLNESDSTILLASRNTEIKISEFSHFYFYRRGLFGLAIPMAIVGTGFGISAAVHPLVSNAQYDPKEQAIISAAMLGTSALSLLFIRKKYAITGNTRIRILNLSFENKEERVGE